MKEIVTNMLILICFLWAAVLMEGPLWCQILLYFAILLRVIVIIKSMKGD